MISHHYPNPFPTWRCIRACYPPSHPYARGRQRGARPIFLPLNWEGGTPLSLRTTLSKFCTKSTPGRSSFPGRRRCVDTVQASSANPAHPLSGSNALHVNRTCLLHTTLDHSRMLRTPPLLLPPLLPCPTRSHAPNRTPNSQTEKCCAKKRDTLMGVEGAIRTEQLAR
jgi:hypothetical protein